MPTPSVHTPWRRPYAHTQCPHTVEEASCPHLVSTHRGGGPTPIPSDHSVEEALYVHLGSPPQKKKV